MSTSYFDQLMAESGLRVPQATDDNNRKNNYDDGGLVPFAEPVSVDDFMNQPATAVDVYREEIPHNIPPVEVVTNAPASAGEMSSFGFCVFWLCLVGGIGCMFPLYIGEGFNGLSITGLVFAILGFLGYFSISFCFADFSSKYWMTEDQAEQLLKRLEEVKPVWNQHMECYHRERRGSDTVEVVTFKLDTEKEFNDFVDYSPRIQFERHIGGRVTKLFVKQEHVAGDRETEVFLQAQEDKIIADNRHRDVSYRFVDQYSVPGMPKVIMVDRSTGPNLRKPWYYSWCLYWMCCLMGLGAPWVCCVRNFCQTRKSYTSLKALYETNAPDGKRREVEMLKENSVSRV